MRPIHYVARVDIGLKRMRMSDAHTLRRMNNKLNDRRIVLIVKMGVLPIMLTKFVCLHVHKS